MRRFLKIDNIFSGYDTLPIDSMQGLEIGGHSGQPTSPYMDMDVGEMDASELTFDQVRERISNKIQYN